MKPTLLAAEPLPGGGRRFRLPDCRWFTQFLLLRPEQGEASGQTEAEEAALLVLAGTFDLQAGSTSWGGRGAREQPAGGRPLVVFLPPRTRFRAAGPTGRLLLVGCRQPPVPAPAEGAALLGRRPLLPLAGSGKAYDPGTGEWRPAETFPDSPELLAPRRMRRTVAGGVATEEVLPADYKARSLLLEELHFPAPGQSSLDLRAGEETLCYAECEAPLRLAAGGAALELASGSALLLPAGPPGPLRVQAQGPAFLVVARAPKSAAP